VFKITFSCMGESALVPQLQKPSLAPLRPSPHTGCSLASLSCNSISPSRALTPREGPTTCWRISLVEGCVCSCPRGMRPECPSSKRGDSG
jgi:hypothetical protein